MTQKPFTVHHPDGSTEGVTVTDDDILTPLSHRVIAECKHRWLRIAYERLQAENKTLKLGLEHALETIENQNAEIAKLKADVAALWH